MHVIILILVVVLIVMLYLQNKKLNVLAETIAKIHSFSEHISETVDVNNRNSGGYFEHLRDSLNEKYEAIRAKQDSTANSLGNFITTSKENHRYIKSQFQIAEENAVKIGNGTKNNLEELKDMLVSKANDDNKENEKRHEKMIEAIANLIQSTGADFKTLTDKLESGFNLVLTDEEKIAIAAVVVEHINKNRNKSKSNKTVKDVSSN